MSMAHSSSRGAGLRTCMSMPPSRSSATSGDTSNPRSSQAAATQAKPTTLVGWQSRSYSTQGGGGEGAGQAARWSV